MSRQNRRVFSKGLITLGLLAMTLMAARMDVFEGYTPWDREYYLTDAQIAFIRPGLEFEILDVSIGEDRTPVVTFSVSDPMGLPLDLNGVQTPGAVSVRFLIGFIPSDRGQYRNYITRSVTSSITGDTADQPTTDSGGTFVEVEPGVYTYTFGTQLPEGFDRDASHRLGAYATRDLREWDLDRDVANAYVDFVPSGGVAVGREVVVIDNCNECHNVLALHGGSRRDTALCVLCHTPENWDPDTGNSVDFKVMIHKIHRGEHLPSVEGGTPYQIIGFRQSVHDYSEIAFPQDIRNCTKCHQDAVQGENYITNPTRAACGSCHDDVNFATGEGHLGGPQISDNLCSACHFPEGELEFDTSILGAHTIPYKSKQLRGLNAEILDVTGTGPGETPSVMFTIIENDGTPIAPMDLPFFNLNLAGPTTDYSTLIRESGQADSVPVDGGYVYTFKEPIPPEAVGSFAVGMEGFRMVQLNPGMTSQVDFRESFENPVTYVAVTDPEPVPRRAVVEDENCEKCHENLAFHGTIRHDPEYCVTCHIPSGTDVDRRPAEDLPPQSRHFKLLIHRIHRGHDLTRDFTIYGFGGTPHNYNELHFPGDLRDCETCHVNDSYHIPLPQGLLPTPGEREFFDPLPPISAACLGCHDSEYAAAHAFTMIAPFGESCAACHGDGAEFAIERVHLH